MWTNGHKRFENTRVCVDRAVILSFCFASTGSHSLMIYATYITGQTPFPECSAVVLLDDVQLMYLDSVTWKLAYRSSSISEHDKEEQVDVNYILNGVLWKMKEQKTYFRNRFNYTDGKELLWYLCADSLIIIPLFIKLK